MKNLGVGQSDFENLMQDNSVYVDKTAYIHKLLQPGVRYYFLSRPRRFGKSLLLSTIKTLFEGKKELFKDLYIYDKIDWEKHPVILLDMGGVASASLEIFINSLSFDLRAIARFNNITLTTTYPIDMFKELIRGLYHATGNQVVLLIDEYEKPILDSIKDLKLANEIRDFLGKFYGIIKGSSDLLRFVLLTGIAKISQVSIFSGLNNLSDITLNEKYAGICGYTQTELEHNFDGHISLLAERYQKSNPDIYQDIKKWYNGYSWNGETFLYNPFSVLKLLEENEFDSYWFSSGTPSFLLQLLRNQNDYSPVLADKIMVSKGFDSEQPLEMMETIPLCFQTGYLTIKKRFFLEGEYELQIPNEEVRGALTGALLSSLTHVPESAIRRVVDKIHPALANHNMEEAIGYFKIFFKNLIYPTHTAYEDYYHVIFDMMMKIAKVDCRTEVRTDIGRIDAVLKFPQRIYIMELKHAETKAELNAALEEGFRQIHEKKYYEPYLHEKKPVHLLAMAFTQGDLTYREQTL